MHPCIGRVDLPPSTGSWGRGCGRIEPTRALCGEAGRRGAARSGGPPFAMRHYHRQRGPGGPDGTRRQGVRAARSDRRRGILECSGCGRYSSVRGPPPEDPPVSLFDISHPEPDRNDAKRPLADRMRPRTLDQFVGQEHILGPGKPLRVQIERDQLTSMILWGPPGSGKTTLAHLIARMSKCEFVPFSAVLAGIKEIKAVMADAEKMRRFGRRTVLFVDEIHRFNKAQQDAFLPYVERGDIILIGATTENPSFEVVSALLSRAKVYALRALTVPEVAGLLFSALADTERGLGGLGIQASDDLLEQIAIYANGDARAAYNILEL